MVTTAKEWASVLWREAAPGDTEKASRLSPRARFQDRTRVLRRGPRA